MQPEGAILEVCHVTRDMDRAIEHWTQVLGAGPFFVFDVPAMPGQTSRGAPSNIDLRIAFGFSGGLLIELVQQLNDVPSVFLEVLETRGEGYHHMLLRTDFDTGAARLTAHGYHSAFAGVMPGGERFALFDTQAGNGGFIELMDLTDHMFGPMQLIHAAHLSWDGKTNPKRNFFELLQSHAEAAPGPHD